MPKKEELSFLEFMQTHRRGELLHRADEVFRELIEAVGQTSGKGVMTIKLPVKVNDAGQIEILPQLQMNKPRPAMGVGIYYATDEGRLTRRDPNQGDMFADDGVASFGRENS